LTSGISMQSSPPAPKTSVYIIDSLIAAVEESFRDMEVKTLEKCFLTLQAVMEQIMLAKGGNDYSLPHVKKKHFSDGRFPSSLPCSNKAFDTAVAALDEMLNNA
jgi:hypothetical protein